MIMIFAKQWREHQQKQTKTVTVQSWSVFSVHALSLAIFFRHSFYAQYIFLAGNDGM